MVDSTTITLADGRIFPVYEGQALSWDLSLAGTTADAQNGYPQLRAVIRAMKAHRPEQLEREQRALVRDSFGALFGHNAKRILAVIDEEA